MEIRRCDPRRGKIDEFANLIGERSVDAVDARDPDGDDDQPVVVTEAPNSTGRRGQAGFEVVEIDSLAVDLDEAARPTDQFEAAVVVEPAQVTGEQLGDSGPRARSAGRVAYPIITFGPV